jgi:hypothetical protein
MSNRGSTNRNAESVYKPNLIDEKDENQQVAIGEKIPLFLVKLWNIVEDPAYYDIIRWDEVYNFLIFD